MVKLRVRSKGMQAILVSLFLFLGVLTSGGSAFSYDGVLSFGDSLTDNGAVGITGYAGGLPDVFGFQRFTTDGYDIWAEYLAGKLNKPLYDVAFGGATSSYDDPSAKEEDPTHYTNNTLGLQWQVDSYLNGTFNSYFGLSGSMPVSCFTLVTVWAGGNDCLATLDGDFRPAIVAANNVAMAVTKLYNRGFRKFVVLTLPDIGQTPALISQGSVPSALATLWSKMFNAQLKLDVVALRLTLRGSSVYLVDAYAVMKDVMANPKKYGFTSGLELFWAKDGFHPSGPGHILIANTVFNSIPKQ